MKQIWDGGLVMHCIVNGNLFYPSVYKKSFSNFTISISFECPYATVYTVMVDNVAYKSFNVTESTISIEKTLIPDTDIPPMDDVLMSELLDWLQDETSPMYNSEYANIQLYNDFRIPAHDGKNLIDILLGMNIMYSISGNTIILRSSGFNSISTSYLISDGTVNAAFKYVEYDSANTIRWYGVYNTGDKVSKTYPFRWVTDTSVSTQNAIFLSADAGTDILDAVSEQVINDVYFSISISKYRSIRVDLGCNIINGRISRVTSYEETENGIVFEGVYVKDSTLVRGRI